MLSGIWLEKRELYGVVSGWLTTIGGGKLTGKGSLEVCESCEALSLNGKANSLKTTCLDI